jgi:hypothetical protein
MFTVGIAFFSEDVTKLQGISKLNLFSIANIDYSSPVCIQQYVNLSESRLIDCGLGGGKIDKLIY